MAKGTQLKTQPKDNNNFNSLIENHNEFLKTLIKDLKNKNEYIYKSIRRKKNFLECINGENLTFEINKISNYESYINLISKYVYKDIFTPDKDEASEYVIISRTIEYDKYQEYQIESSDLENELINILLTNKRLYKDEDQFNTILIPFELFKGNNKNLLSRFLRIYKNSEEILDNNLYDTFINDILQRDETIINLFIDNWISARINLNVLFYNENSEALFDKKKEIITEIKSDKNYLENKKYNNDAKADFIIQNYFTFQKVILYLTNNIIFDEELTLYEILTNIPELINVSNYSLYYFEKHPEYKLKHLFALYELVEKILYKYILSFVDKEEYEEDISDEQKDEIISYFEENENNIEDQIFTKSQLISALRKYISRYLTDSCINKNSNQDDYYQKRYSVQKELLLFDELNKIDLWPKEIYGKLFYGFENLKKYQFLVKHSVKLYECLSEIEIRCNERKKADFNKKFEDSVNLYERLKKEKGVNDDEINIEKKLKFNIRELIYKGINDECNFHEKFSMINYYDINESPLNKEIEEKIEAVRKEINHPPLLSPLGLF